MKSSDHAENAPASPDPGPQKPENNAKTPAAPPPGHPSDPRARRIIAGVISLPVIAGLIGLYFFDPADGGIYPPCLLHRATGLYCAGCGTARALHQLIHGHVLTALDLNPLLILALPIIAWMALPRLIAWLRGRTVRPFSLRRRTLAAVIVLVVLYTIARNIPAWPFSILAP